jgi:lysine 2-monooxygenase
MIDCTFDHAGEQKQFKTRYLFLCMPPRSLELLDHDSDFFAQMHEKQYFESVIRQPSFKLLFLYKDRWYRNVQIRGQSIKPFGPTITDLPLRMIWYFDPDPPDTYWALLACYCDMTSEEFWSVMEEVPPPPGYPGSRKPTKEMIEMARSQLQSVHGVDIPLPDDAVFQDWALDPYGAGYHAWAAHYSPWDMFNRMLHPIASYNVFICGEAYSLDQGWVEGALSTVDACLNLLPIPRLRVKVSPGSSSMGLRRL